LDAEAAPEARRHAISRRTSIAAIASVLLVVGLGVAVLQRPEVRRSLVARSAGFARRNASWPRSPWLNAHPDVKYVGDAECARCHADIAETFRRHPMGRSLTPIASAPAVGFTEPNGSANFGVEPSVFTVEREGGREIHRESFRDAGKVLVQVEAEVAYAVGSGARSISYLVERDGRLFESPITWYSQKQKWDLSPGFEKTSAHFERPIDPDCLFCHSNRVTPAPLTANRYEQPIFLGHAIGCERCHGPGELHARSQEVTAGPDFTIVNPRHLDPVLRGNVCEQCHLVGDRRVNRLGRDATDYRPGLPLTDFFADYSHATEEGQKLVGQVEQMKASRCYRSSEGRLGCISCHDAHELPDPDQKVAYFRERCLVCHARRGCQLDERVRLARSRENDCVACHLPVSKTVDAIHIAVHDHRILRKPHEQGGPVWPKPGDTRFPLVRLNGGRGPEEPKTPDRELAIAITSEGTRLPNTPQIRRVGPLVISALDKALVEHPDDLVALRMKAQALAFTGRKAQALRIADTLLESTPYYELLIDDYCSYAIDLKRFQAALEPAKRAVALNPYSASYRERLAFLSIQVGDWKSAQHQAAEALRLNPFLKFARMFMVRCLLHSKATTAAEKEFATLVKLHANERESLEEWFAEQKRR
jgi:hypothetical protein